MTLGWGPKPITSPQDDGLSPERGLFLCNLLRRCNHHGIRTGEELGLVAVLPLHPVMHADRSLQDFDYLTAPPGGAALADSTMM